MSSQLQGLWFCRQLQAGRFVLGWESWATYLSFMLSDSSWPSSTSEISLASRSFLFDSASGSVWAAPVYPFPRGQSQLRSQPSPLSAQGFSVFSTAWSPAVFFFFFSHFTETTSGERIYSGHGFRASQVIIAGKG